MKTPVIGICGLLCASSAMLGQATSTASRSFDLQAGGGFNLVQSDYYPQKFKGFALYTTLDFKPHLGVEFDFHQSKASQDPTYERTYEWGVRYHRTYGRLQPYLKVMYGRGVFNYVVDSYDSNGNVTASVVVANLAYNELSFGGGVDYHLKPYLNVRGDYTYQSWRSFVPNGLTPMVYTIGVAYHVPGGLQKGRRFR